MNLESIGADTYVRELFQSQAGDGTQLARVSFASHELYRILNEEGEREGAVSGRLRVDGTLPVVGDWVVVRPVDSDLVLIEDVLPRRTRFSRRAAGREAVEQVIAANIDVALIVCGLDGDFNLRRIERYLVLARESGAEPVVVLNKADTCRDLRERIDAVMACAGGTQVLALTATNDVSPLEPIVKRRTAALLGSSGAGKSTIVNALLNEGRQATGAVRASDSRGRHTTTSRMLIPLPGGGAIIDSPGMRELQMWASAESLDSTFEEIAEAAGRCRFQDCSHSGEPGCAVHEALEEGLLDLSRWENYCKLQREIRHHETQSDVHARIAEKNRWKAIHKTLRAHPKYRR